eukprot:4923730-Pleurochrysis_carterae.AAC.4
MKTNDEPISIFLEPVTRLVLRTWDHVINGFGGKSISLLVLKAGVTKTVLQFCGELKWLHIDDEILDKKKVDAVGAMQKICEEDTVDMRKICGRQAAFVPSCQENADYLGTTSIALTI